MTVTLQVSNMGGIAKALGQLPRALRTSFIPTTSATFTVPGPSGNLVNDLDCDGVELSVPFFARISVEDDCVIASHPDLPVWGEGSNAEDALDDMCREFVARYRFLADNESRLGDALREELARFRDVLA